MNASMWWIIADAACIAFIGLGAGFLLAFVVYMWASGRVWERLIETIAASVGGMVCLCLFLLILGISLRGVFD
jgi:hypothetical protein